MGIYIRFFALITLLLTSQFAKGLSFMPLLHNYGASDYQAGLQNWDADQSSSGELFVANSMGVLCFDGYNWSLTPLPGNAVARSVLCDGGRLYVGAYRNFGYMERDEFGQLQFTSLWPEEYQPHEDEIWNIVRDKAGVVYFQSFAGWFAYDGKHVTSHFDQSLLPLYFHEVDGEIYVQIQEGDYYRLDGGHFTRLFARNQVSNDHIVAAVAAPGGGLLLCSQSNGLFLWRDGQVTRWACDVAAQLAMANINRATLVQADSTIVVGTILGGIFAIDHSGHLKWNYHMGNHLANNCILDLMSDSDGNVWASMDTGLAMIACSSPFTLFTPDLGRPSLGMVYGLCMSGGKLYIATNQAAWQFAPDTHECFRITGSEGQNWHITELDGMLLLGNNSGAKLINPTLLTAMRINDQQSSSTCLRQCNINGKELLIESSYYNMRIYLHSQGSWQYSHEVEGLHAPIAEFEVDPSGAIWAAHMSRGVFRIILSDNLKQATIERFDRLGDDSVPSLAHVMKIRGRIVIRQNHKLYTYDDMQHKIVPYTKLDSALADINIDAATAVDGNSLWLASAEGFKYVRYEGDKFRLIHSVTPEFFGLDCNDNKNNVYVHNQVAYFNLNNGVGRYDMTANSSMDTSHYRMSVRRVLTRGRDGQEQLLPVASSKGKLPQAMPFVQIELSYPNFNFSPLTFEFALRGSGVNLKSSSASPVVDYSALGYGSYTFIATVKSLDGRVLDTTEYRFVVHRPFYLSWWAWLFYAAIMAGAVYALVQYRTRKTAEQMRRQYEDKRLQQDLKVLEQEKIIAEQKHQLLEAKLNDKAREAASLALDAAARNQAIEGLRDTLREKRRKGAISQTDMAAMLGQLGDSADSDNFWEVYQNNFNLVHKNFFKNLKERHPSLTPTDLRFCALLRLNLSTKDIAQFTGLSVRGVEGARYRLRKKLGLPDGANLVDFLIHFE